MTEVERIAERVTRRLEETDPLPPHYLKWVGPVWQAAQMRFWGWLWLRELKATHRINTDSFVFRRFKHAEKAGHYIRVFNG